MPPLFLTLKRSVYGSVIFIALHALAFLAVELTFFSVSEKLLLDLLIFAHFFGCWSIPVSRVWMTPGGVKVQVNEGPIREVAILRKTFVSPWVTIVHFRALTSSWRHAVVIWPDSVSSEIARRLRLVLRGSFR